MGGKFLRALTRMYRENQKIRLKKQFEDFYNTVKTLLQEHTEVLEANMTIIEEPYYKICETIEQL